MATSEPESAGTSRSGNPRQRYQIVKKLDMGGMAEIFLGKAQSIGGIERTVAIKRVLPSLTKNDSFITMFLDEARLSMKLSHANIVQVFDVGRSGGTYFIVMEFVDGINLRRLFQKASEKGVRVPLELGCYVATQICQGLAYAHEKRSEQGDHLRIVHRDLSPPNVLISRDGEVKLTDFGLAKALSHVSVTDPGVVKGKFSYLAPEAAEGKQVDHRADIFAAGICLWEVLVNRRLFLGKDDMETVELIRQAEVPSLSALNPKVTHEFERVLGRALEKDPKKRYTSAREFGDALADYLFKHNLKVQSYDLAGMVDRLFGEGRGDEGAPEERIGSLIQEEILSLSMMGKVGAGAGDVDGSRPIDASSLAMVVQPRFDLAEFWKNAGVPDATAIPQGKRTATVRAMETVRSPDDLVDMLEGGGLERERERRRTVETDVADLPPEADARGEAAAPSGAEKHAPADDKPPAWKTAAVFVLVAGGAAAAVWYLLMGGAPP